MLEFTPKSTEEMVFANAETKQLLSEILSHKVSFPSNGKNTLLLYGTYGSGKTTYANIFFKEYENTFKKGSVCANDDSQICVSNIEVDGNEKITTTVDKLNSICSFVSFNASDKHYFLFDEVDGYSWKQQKRLKGWLNRSDVVCVMTTNHIEEIDKGLRSRCYQIEFNASANIADYVVRMRDIVHQYKLPMLSDVQLYKIAEKSKGDWREMCALLQRVCSNISTPPQNHTKLRIV